MPVIDYFSSEHEVKNPSQRLETEGKRSEIQYLLRGDTKTATQEVRPETHTEGTERVT